jgi:hypothetical protein
MKLFVILDTPLVFMFIRCNRNRRGKMYRSKFLAILNALPVFMFIYCSSRRLFAVSDNTPVFVSCVAKPELQRATHITLQEEEIIFPCSSLNMHCIEQYFTSFLKVERGASEEVAKCNEKLARRKLLTGNKAT